MMAAFCTVHVRRNVQNVMYAAATVTVKMYRNRLFCKRVKLLKTKVVVEHRDYFANEEVSIIYCGHPLDHPEWPVQKSNI